MIFTNGEKLYKLYCMDGDVNDVIMGASITNNALQEFVNLVGGSEKSRKITEATMIKNFKIIDFVEVY